MIPTSARAVLVASATALVASLTVATPASAKIDEGRKGYFTMWQDDGYEGHSEARKGYDTNLHNDSCAGCDFGPGGDFGDDMSSFVNKTPYWVKIYVNKEYDWDDHAPYYSWYCVRPYSHDADLGNNKVKGQLEDEISSIDVTPEKTKPILCRDYQVIGHKN
ncbi:peptidase inhibitor family I36 protein [Nocardioides sp. SYSU D00038]|uniref:peptidase inhibitor family I36 protein n=1 Tax=Nocardioides sp. SYSU D00038 TaxID=2812554 RepID=UPI00196864BC|nr:peptidase inhibitor family I36 protein [Nocardioides sp. SYSU D00038]